MVVRGYRQGQPCILSHVLAICHTRCCHKFRLLHRYEDHEVDALRALGLLGDPRRKAVHLAADYYATMAAVARGGTAATGAARPAVTSAGDHPDDVERGCSWSTSSASVSSSCSSSSATGRRRRSRRRRRHRRRRRTVSTPVSCSVNQLENRDGGGNANATAVVAAAAATEASPAGAEAQAATKRLISVVAAALPPELLLLVACAAAGMPLEGGAPLGGSPPDAVLDMYEQRYRWRK